MKWTRLLSRSSALEVFGWIADAIVTQISGLNASLARYRREFERARLARLHDHPS